MSRRLVYGLPAGLLLYAMTYLACTSCGLLPPWLGGSPVVKPPDPLTDPFGHILSLLRTVAQWAAIAGILCIFPRPRSILLPIISWMWTVPRGTVTAKEAAKDVVLAAPRLVGLVHSRKPSSPSRKK